MTIKTIIRERVLTKINTNLGSMGKENEQKRLFSIVLYCFDRGSKYYISTGLTTTNENMIGTIFSDEDESVRVNNIKSLKLQRILSDSEQFSMMHQNESVDFIKKGIQEIVHGGLDINKQMYLADYIMEFAKNGRHGKGTIKAYEQTQKKVLEFDPKATLESVDEDWLYGLEKKLKKTMTTNGYAIVFRNLRAVFNWARKKKKLTKNYPFEDFHIKQARTRKVVLTAQDIADFRDFPCQPWQERYRDYFMLQVYLCGIDIVDLCHLKSVKGGRIKFYRQKNECHDNMSEVDLPVVPEAMELIRKYRSKGNEYLLDCMDGRVGYQSFARSMNKALKKIGFERVVLDKVGKMRKIEYYPIIHGISTKTSRRTFATMAMRMGVAEQLVGMALGHAWSASNTTQIYEWFDSHDMDDAIRRVFRNLSNLKGRSKEEIIEGIKEREGL